MTIIRLLLLLAAAPALADEVFLSSTPPPMRRDPPAYYQLTELRLRLDRAAIDIRMLAVQEDGQCARGARGACQEIVVEYRGEEAATLLAGLNTANLATKSLRRRLIERLQADGHLPAGTIAALPTATATATETNTATVTPQAQTATPTEAAPAATPTE